MSLIMMVLFMIMTSIMFMNMTHPLTLGLTLLIQTLNMCLMVGMMSKSFWFSFILFLILLGGMLVLFMYVISLAPNEKFTLTKSMFFFMVFMMLMFILIIMLTDKMEYTSMFNNKEMNSISNMTSYFSENSLSLNKLYNPPTYMMTMILIIYLLITLITIVHITKAFFGPLRTFYKELTYNN